MVLHLLFLIIQIVLDMMSVNEIVQKLKEYQNKYIEIVEESNRFKINT